jgi:hypothetical protein
MVKGREVPYERYTPGISSEGSLSVRSKILNLALRNTDAFDEIDSHESEMVIKSTNDSKSMNQRNHWLFRVRKRYNVYISDTVYSVIFLVTVILPSPWANLWKWYLGSTYNSEMDLFLKQFWIFATCTLCCAYLPTPCYDPWVVLYEQQPTRRKATRIIVQASAGIFLAFALAAFDRVVLPDFWDLKTDFMGASTPASPFHPHTAPHSCPRQPSPLAAPRKGTLSCATRHRHRSRGRRAPCSTKPPTRASSTPPPSSPPPPSPSLRAATAATSTLPLCAGGGGALRRLAGRC